MKEREREREISLFFMKKAGKKKEKEESVETNVSLCFEALNELGGLTLKWAWGFRFSYLSRRAASAHEKGRTLHSGLKLNEIDAFIS